MIDAAVDGRIALKVVVRDAAVRARRVGVDAAAVLQLPALVGLHRLDDRVVSDLDAAHV